MGRLRPEADLEQLTHLVSNPGTVDLVSVALTDGAVEIPCPEDALPAGKAMVCTVHGVAEAGPHRLVARVSGISTRAQKVTDEDTSHYQGLLPVEGSGDSRSP